MGWALGRLAAGSGRRVSGLIRRIFLKFGEITDSGRSKFKNCRNIVYCFKILGKDKNQQKIYKKTRLNSNITGEEIL
jgi:hypothetical protein